MRAKTIFSDLHFDPQEPPNPLPAITQRELLAYLNARSVYRLARADFEARKGELFKKILLFCEPEEGSIKVEVNDGMTRIKITEYGSIPPSVWEIDIY